MLLIKKTIFSISSIFLLALFNFVAPIIRFQHWQRRRIGASVRSLWSGAPIISIIANARAERFLGVEAYTIVFNTYYITDAFDYDLSRYSKNRVVRIFLQYMVFLWACFHFDRFHFFIDYGLLPQLESKKFNKYELLVYKLLNKEVFFWTYGADVRTHKQTKALGEPNCCTECPSVNSCVCSESEFKDNYKKILDIAKAVFSMGDMIEYTPGSRNDLFFWPVDIHAENGNKYLPVYPEANCETTFRIVHAPNHRHFKGTHFLLEAVERIKRDGIAIELILVEKMPNKEALDIYRSADIIFDQCLIGFHGYFANEAMAMGKPVMCFIRDPERYLLHSEECPIINARSEQVEYMLRDLIRNRTLLHNLGKQGRLYVEKYLTVEAFSKRLREAYIELGIMKS